MSRRLRSANLKGRMAIRFAFGAALLVIAASHAQTASTAAKKPERRPACSPGEICFSGEVSEGKEFRRSINDQLDFVLQPAPSEGDRPGWTIAVAPKKPVGDCNEFASVVSSPYRGHRELDIDMSYGVTADEEMDDSPREFQFVTNCADYAVESARLKLVLWPYTATDSEVDDAMAKLGTSPQGTGRMWITEFKIDRSPDTSDQKPGRIAWFKFAVEITLPKR